MIVGGASGAVTGAALDAPLALRVVMVGVGVFGGLLPDADTHSSILGKKLPKWWHEATPGHRGMTHSLLYCLAVYYLAVGVQLLILHWRGGEHPEHAFIPAALAVGAFSHLLADSMTTMGVPILYPLRWNFRLFGKRGSFTTGTKPEGVAVFVILALTAGYVLYPIIAAATGSFDAPPVHGVPTKPAILFVATSLLAALLMMAYTMRNLGAERELHAARRSRRASGTKSRKTPKKRRTRRA